MKINTKNTVGSALLILCCVISGCATSKPAATAPEQFRDISNDPRFVRVIFGTNVISARATNGAVIQVLAQRTCVIAKETLGTFPESLNSKAAREKFFDWTPLPQALTPQTRKRVDGTAVTVLDRTTYLLPLSGGRSIYVAGPFVLYPSAHAKWVTGK